MDLLPQDGDALQPDESIQSQQLVFRPPDDQTDTEGQDRTDDRSPATAESQREKMYHSVLHHMQQQQMAKRGRRVKKKTLMKMAKLYVISKGWDSEMMEATDSNGPAPEHEQLALNQEEDTLVPLVSSKSDRVHTNSVKDGKKESLPLTVSTDAGFSGQTEAPVTLSRRKTRHSNTSIKQTKEESGAAEMSTNLLDDSQESLLYSRPVKASKKKGKLKKITSVTLQEDTKTACDDAAAPKKQASEKRKKTKSGVKNGTKEQLLPQTLTEYDDVKTQDVSESNEMDVNAARQKHKQRKMSGLTSGNNVCDKETILSTISTAATFSGQTAAPFTLKKKKTSRTSKKKIKESGAAETDWSTSTNFPDESQEPRLYSGPGTSSKKKKTDSVTLKEDTKITCDNSELSRNNPAEISSVDAPKKQTSKQRKNKTKASIVGEKRSTNFSGMDLNAAKQEQDKSKTDSLKDGKNSCGKESVLSTVSTDATFSDQTVLAATLKQRKRPRASKKQAKEESETGCGSSTNLLNESQESLLNSGPVKASKKRKISSVTLKEDTKITCDNSELSRNNQAEISGVDSPKKQASKRTKKMKSGVKKSTKQKLQRLDSNAAEQTHDKGEMSELTSQCDTIRTNSLKDGKTDCDRAVTASKKQMKLRRSDSETLKGDKKITCEKSEVSRNSPAETSSVDAPEKRSKRRKKTTEASKVGVEKCNKPKLLPQSLAECKVVKTQDVSEGFLEPLLADRSSIQETVRDGMDLNAAKQKHSKSVTSSQRDTVKTNSLKVGEKDHDKEAVLPTVSTDATSSLNKRETLRTSKKKAKEESQLTGAAETECRSSTNLLDESPEPLLNSRPVTASKKKKIRSATLNKDVKITCDNGEPSRNNPAEISGVDAPKKQTSEQRKKTKSGVKNSTKQKLLPQTLTEHKDVKTRDVVDTSSDPLLADSASIQDALFNGKDLNAVKHGKIKASELTPEVTPSIQDESGPVESVPAAVPARKTKKRRRRNKDQWTARKKLKQRRINAHSSNPADVFSSSPCDSVSGDERIKLKDENDRNAVQTQTANIKDKHFSKHKTGNPRHHEVKSQKPLKCSFCGRSFRHITAFTVHRRIHTGEKPYGCQTCGKRFSQISKLGTHSKIHSEPHAVCCPCCNEKFKSKGELISHFHVHVKSVQISNKTGDANNQQVDDCLDSPSSNKPFRCSVCFKEFLNGATLKIHKRTHGGKSYTCSICGKKFCKPSSLSIHEKTHWPVQPYSCSVCCKGFDKLQELKRHSQMHSEDSPFSCAKCEKHFSSFKLLSSHQEFEVCCEKQDAAHGNRREIDGFFVSQSVEGPIVTPVFFKCQICKQLHRHWCQHVLHLQTHTHSKSYTCETCEQQYDQAAGIRIHCAVCCSRSGEERACRSALTGIWMEPGAPENQVFEPHLDDQSLPLDEDKKVQMPALPQVEKVEKEFVDTSSTGSASLCVNDSSDKSVSSLSSGFCPASDRAPRQPSRFRLQSLIRRHCGRYSCGHCGKAFSRWDKLWVHKRHHRQTSRASLSCSQCDLEFRFLGSYIDHQREHAAQTPYACPLCPDAFVNEENLSVHVSECHKRCDYKKCSICGKNFSTLKNLKKHKMLHKGVNSHFCLPCNISFFSNSALKTHLKTHKTRLSVPRPAGPVERLLFPYHCRRCTATFSSTDLLQAHQVCHFIAGRKPEKSPPESVASFISSRAAVDAQAGVSGSSQRKRRLPVSKKKHLFRYPHPDRLYVVPVVSSEPPVVISDTEEERPSITTSSSTVSDFPGASPTVSNLPQSSSVSTLRDTDGHETGSSENQLQDHSDKSSVLPESHPGHDSCTGIRGLSGLSGLSDSDLPEPVRLFIMDNELVDEVHSCAICMQTFTDMSQLHEHYVDHARRE